MKRREFETLTDFTILIVVWAIFLKVFNLFSSIVAFVITAILIVCYCIFLFAEAEKRRG